MTLNLTPKEMDVLSQISEDDDLTKTGVIRQALRMYQLIRDRIRSGETMHFSDDKERQVLFLGIGFDHFEPKKAEPTLQHVPKDTTDNGVSFEEIGTRVAYVNFHTPIEKRASDLVWALEKLACHPIITNAQSKAIEIRSLLAEWHILGEPGGYPNRYEPQYGDDVHEHYVPKQK